MSRSPQTAPRADFSFYVLLHGVVQHDLYHTGQIALLEKALTAGVARTPLV